MDIKEQIKNEITKNKVMIYMKGSPDAPQCGFSAAVVNLLKSHGVNFGSRNVLEDPELRQGIKDFSNWPTIPQIFINGEFIGGCDILHELDKNGELKKLLEQVKQ